jgi:hypothetical protein
MCLKSKIILLNILLIVNVVLICQRDGMSLRPGLMWLTLNLALIIQCSSRNNIYIFLILHIL